MIFSIKVCPFSHMNINLHQSMHNAHTLSPKSVHTLNIFAQSCEDFKTIAKYFLFVSAAKSVGTFCCSYDPFCCRYKLEQTIRHLHGFHGTSDPRASFPAAPFSGV